MEKLILVCLVVLRVLMSANEACATELWDPHLRGLNEGLASGLLPPPGFYYIHSTYVADWRGYGKKFGAAAGDKNSDFQIFGYINVPSLMWVTPWKFLGADYSMIISQPFSYTNMRIQGETAKKMGLNANNNSGSLWGTYGTILLPYQLSWRLPCGFSVSTGLAITMKDASTNFGNVDPGVYAPNGNNTWAFEPSVGLSWLHGGWNLSAALYYAFQTEDPATDYQSGQQFAADYTASYNYEKWAFGIGAAQEYQTTKDKQYGSTLPNSTATAWTMGPILGYNFGPFSLLGTVNFPLYSDNVTGGTWFNIRLVIPLGTLGI